MSRVERKIMKNKPNMFRVRYKVMEGNNYAGGWGKRTADVKELGDTIGFQNIQSVTPIYVEEFKPLHHTEVQHAQNARRDEIERQEKKDAVTLAEAKLKKAKKELDKSQT